MDFKYQINRPVLLLAPDAIITINQNINLPVCKDCGASSRIVDLVTRLNVNLSLDNSPGTASFELAVPKHNSSQVYESGKLNIPLMSEVQIFIKGRFLANGEPQYYQVFWGMITNVENSYSDGFYSIHVSCEDMLKWWDISSVITQDSALNSLNTASPFRALSNVYSNLTAQEIIYALSIAMFKDQLLLKSLDIGNPAELKKLIKTNETVYETALNYWRARFSTLGEQSLSIAPRMDSKTAQAIKAAILTENPIQSGNPLFKTREYKPIATKGGYFDEADIASSLPLYAELSGGQDPFNLGVRTALEIAREVKDRINFEFFMDTGGVITFKPPYYNLATKGVEQYFISNLDLLSYQITHNLDNIFSRIDIEGSFYHDSIGNKPSIFYIDAEKAKLYGIRQQKVSYNFLRNTKDLFTFGISEINRLNTKEYTGTIEIAGRPEIKLGVPVYLEAEDIYCYVRTISHDFTFGQSYTTSLGVDAIRRSAPSDVKEAKNKYLVFPDTSVKVKKEDRDRQIQGAYNTDKTDLDRLYAAYKKEKGLTQPTLTAYLRDVPSGIGEFINFAKSPAKKELYETAKDALSRLSNIIDNSNLVFDFTLESNPPASGVPYFQKYGEDYYEQIVGFKYGSQVKPDTLISGTSVDIVKVPAIEFDNQSIPSSSQSNQNKPCSCPVK